jgi:NAD(P)-dependent dehydrogenase (short-subunit alcohol dehydrogenase family)
MSPNGPLSGRVCLVTGATSGIGRATAVGLARMGASLIVSGRSRERGEETLAEIGTAAPEAEVRLLLGDLSSLAGVRGLAERVLETTPALHVLVNNAGLVTMKRTTTADGFETMFGVNHLAPFLLTGLLLPRLRESGPARIVNVASEAHRFGGPLDLDDLQAERRFRGFGVYGRSKAANILFTYELARRLGDGPVTANCLNPGATPRRLGRGGGRATDLLQRAVGLFLKSPEAGARTSIHLAAAPDLKGVSGRYFVSCRERRSAAHTYDESTARRLWETSEALCGIRYP